MISLNALGMVFDFGASQIGSCQIDRLQEVINSTAKLNLNILPQFIIICNRKQPVYIKILYKKAKLPSPASPRPSTARSPASTAPPAAPTPWWTTWPVSPPAWTPTRRSWENCSGPKNKKQMKAFSSVRFWTSVRWDIQKRAFPQKSRGRSLFLPRKILRHAVCLPPSTGRCTRNPPGTGALPGPSAPAGPEWPCSGNRTVPGRCRSGTPPPRSP